MNDRQLDLIIFQWDPNYPTQIEHSLNESASRTVTRGPLNLFCSNGTFMDLVRRSLSEFTWEILE